MLGKHASVYNMHGELLSTGPGILSMMEDWELNVISVLRGMWQTHFHTGMRLEVAEVQLVRPL